MDRNADLSYNACSLKKSFCEQCANVSAVSLSSKEAILKLESVTIAGLSVELEERTCEGGCGKKFKVLPSSSVRTARRNCEAACKGTIDEAIKALGVMTRGAKKPGGRKGAKKDLPSRTGKDHDDEGVEPVEQDDLDEDTDGDDAYEPSEEAS